MSFHFPTPAVGLPRLRRKGAGRCAALCAAFTLLAAPVIPAAEDPGADEGRGEAYYHFALGHLYHQFAQQFMRQEYVERAATEYKAALERDPTSLVIRTELINLFAGANRLPEAEEVAAGIFAEDPDNIEVRKLLGSIYHSYANKQRQKVNMEFLVKAIAQFERVAALEPDVAENHQHLGTLYHMAEKRAQAERAMKRALELDPGLTDAQVNLAYLQLEAGQIRAAIGSLESIVTSGASERRHIETLASAYEQVGRFRDAATMYRKLIENGRNTLEARKRLAENLFLSRQFGPALEQYEALIEAEPKESAYLVRIAQIARQREDFPAAWTALNQARRIEPDSIEVQLEALDLLQAEGKIEQAADQTQELLRSTRKAEYSPSEKNRRSVLLQRLGLLLRELDRTAGSIAAFEEVATLDPNAKPVMLTQVIESWRAAGDYARAESEARKAVAATGRNEMLVYQLSNVLSDRGKTKEAVKVIEQLVKNEKSDLEVLLAMARIYEKGRQFDKAEEAIDRAREYAESDGERIGVLFAYGSLHERADRIEQAESKFRELLEIDPSNAPALNYLGYIFADRNIHLDEAHDLIQRALDIEPDNGAFLDSLGWVYYRQNKLELATKFLERSLKQYGDDPVVHSHLGDVYFKLGRVEDAKLHWSRGLEEWKRTAPVDRDADEIESLRRKLASLKLSMAGDSQSGNKKLGVER